jgi:hypothetical protein
VQTGILKGSQAKGFTALQWLFTLALRHSLWPLSMQPVSMAMLAALHVAAVATGTALRPKQKQFCDMLLATGPRAIWGPQFKHDSTM